MAIQIRISRAQNDKTRLGRVLPVQENHNTQATLQRLMPHDGGIHGLLTACKQNGHSICPYIEPPQGGISLRRTRIGLPRARKSIAQSPSTTSASRRRYGSDKPVVLIQ